MMKIYDRDGAPHPARVRIALAAKKGSVSSPSCKSREA